MYTYRYPHPAVTVDVAAFTIGADALQLLLIRRAHDPFRGKWALPGGFVDYDEDLEDAARRELEEETGLRCGLLEQFGAFGRPGRDPRERTITIAYLAAFPPDAVDVRAGDDAAQACWFGIDVLPPLAFDHAEVIACALSKLRIAIEHTAIGLDLLPPAFSREQLCRVHEIVLGHPIDAERTTKTLLDSGRIAFFGDSGTLRAVRSDPSGMPIVRDRTMR